jgi:excisionase family DNA binding protein
VAERLWSRREVAEYLDVPEATLARWAYMGAGPPYFRVGRHTRYSPADVFAWLEKQRSPENGQAATVRSLPKGRPRGQSA